MAGFSSFVKLMRVRNGLIAFLAVLVGYWASSGGVVLGFPGILLALTAGLSAFLILSAGNAINDYYDKELDKAAGKDRPIPTGEVDAEVAAKFALILFLLGIFVAGFVGIIAVVVALTASVLLLVYSAYLKEFKYLGNVVVSILSGLTILFGAAVKGSFYLPLLLSLAPFFATMAREVTKDLEDLASDEGGKRSLPFILGEEKAKTFIYFYSLCAIVFGGVSASMLKSLYLPFYFAGVLLFLLASLSVNNNLFKQAQRLQVAAFSVILAGYFFGLL